MAISTVGSVSAAVTSATNGNLTFTEPTGVTINDILVVSLTIRGSRGYATPSGWTKLHEDLTGNTTVNTAASKTGYQVFWIRRGSTAPTLTFTANGTGTADLSYGRIRAYRGQNLTTPWRSSFANTQASAVTPFTSTGTAAVTAGDMIVQCLFGATNVTWSLQRHSTGPTSLTELIDTGTTSGADGSHAWAELLASSNLASSTLAATPSATALHAMFVGILQPEPTYAKTNTLTENFNDNSIDGSKWTQGNPFFNSTTGVGVAETNSQLELTIVSGDATFRYSGLRSANLFDLTGSSVVVKYVQKPGLDGTEMEFGVHDDSNNSAFWDVYGTLYTGEVYTKLGAASAVLVSGTSFNTTSAPTWFRIRESGGTLFFDSAPDSASNPPTEGEWVNRGSVTSPFPVTGVRPFMCAGNYSLLGSAPKAIYDGLNTASGAGSATYTLTVTAQSIAVTPPAVGMYWTRKINVTTGLYSVSAAPVNLLRNRLLTVSAQSYGVAGGSVVLLRNRNLGISPAAVSVNTSTITLLRRLLLGITPASAAVSANPVGMLRNRLLSVSPQSYAVNTSNVTMDVRLPGSYTLNVLPATYTVATNAVTLTGPAQAGNGDNGLFRQKGRR